MLMQGLFDGIDPRELQAVARQFEDEKEAAEASRATRSANRHHLRRATAEKVLADLLPNRLADGDSWHVMSRGDIDALSYVRHLLGGVSHFDHLLMSTWCIARKDLEEISTWLDAGRVEQFDLYAGEIFPSQYGDEYELMQTMCSTFGCRLVVAKNHSKVTLLSNADEAYYVTVESSANVNTNPRIEQSTMHCSREIHAFYLEFFSGIRSVDRHTARH